MTDPKTPTLPAQLPAPCEPTEMADAHATRLMDELFGGIERALAGDLDALEEAAPIAEKVPEKADLALTFSEGGLPAVLLSDVPEEPVFPLASSLAPSPSSAETSLTVAKEERRFWTVNGVLLGAAGLALAATLGLWLHQRQQASVAMSSAPAAGTASPAESHAEFLEYLRRSLNLINQNASESTVALSTPVPEVPVSLSGAVPALPPISNGALPSPGLPPASGSINVIERIYVPYPSAAVATPEAAGQPADNAAGTVAQSPEAIGPVHTLMGILELGDRSAALFEIDGVPQRVYIGESIGSGGWSLVSVSNEEAVIRRNGEVRSIFIGQQF